MGRMMYLLALICITVVAHYLANSVPATSTPDLVVFALCTMFFMGAAATIRADDAGKPLWWGLLACIPIVSLVAVIYLLVVPSKPASPAS